MHTWGENYNFEGKTFEPSNNYKIYGTSVNYLLDNKILDIPDYIKVDVDGIEHLILEGSSKYLQDSRIKSFSLELNENFKKQIDTVLKIMKENNFSLKHKKRAEYLEDYKDVRMKKFITTFLREVDYLYTVGGRDKNRTYDLYDVNVAFYH